MANIGVTDFYIDVKSLPRGEFESYSNRLFDGWEEHVRGVLGVPDYSLALDVEEGSIKARAKIVAALGALYLGIAQYGSFISGLEIIQNQVRDIGTHFGELAAAPYQSQRKSPRVRRRSETLAALQRLFAKVQKREITVHQAMMDAENILGEEASSAPEFMKHLENSLIQTPLLPKQIPLPLEEIDSEELPETEIIGKKPTSPKPKKPRQIPQQFRVEVWRDSKTSKKNFRVTEL